MKNRLHLLGYCLILTLLTSLCPAQVTLKEKIGQMIMVGFSNNTNFEDSVFYDIQNRNLGSVILMGRNIDSPSQVRQLCADLQEAAAVLTINAGTDILLYTTNEYNNRSLTAHLIETVMDSIAAGAIPESRIHESYERIMDLKERVNTGILSPPQDIAQGFEFSVYPNPFNISTTLSLTVSEDVSGSAQISIFSLDGRRVMNLELPLSGQGTYSIPWNGTDFHGNPVPTGTYIYTLDCGQTILSGKMTMLK